MNGESGSIYDQFGDKEIPAIEQRERTVGQFANRKDMSTPYINKETPRHVQEAMQVEQVDESGMAFWRMFTRQQPKGSFEQSVNIEFGGRPEGFFDYKEVKFKYIALYKKLMNEFNSEEN